MQIKTIYVNEPNLDPAEPHQIMMICCKVIVRLLPASAPNIKDVRRIRLDPGNTLLFGYLEYVETNR